MEGRGIMTYFGGDMNICTIIFMTCPCNLSKPMYRTLLCKELWMSFLLPVNSTGCLVRDWIPSRQKKMFKSPDRSGHKEEMRLKFFPKVSFPHYKLNLCTSQAQELRWSEKVITRNLYTWLLFLKVFFIAFPWKYEGDWTYRIPCYLKHTASYSDIFPFVKWRTFFTDAVNSTGKLDAIKNPMKHSKQHQHLLCIQYIVKRSFFCFLTGKIFMYIHCICRAFFSNAVSIEWLYTINLSRHTNTHRNNTDCDTLKHGICILEQNWTSLIEVSW